MSDGKFRHEGVERPCKEGGPFAVEIDFGGGNTARLVFDKGLTRFDQYDGGERLLFTGRRTDGDQNKPAAGRSELAVGESAVLRGHAGYVWSAAFSGDGKRLVSVGQHGPVILWDVATRSKVWAAEVAGDLRAAAFISAGRQIAVQKAGGLVVLSAGSGEVEDESRFPANGWGRFSPDGRHLALTTVNDSKSRIHSVPSGRVEYEHPAKYATSQRGYVFPTNDGCFAGLNEVFRLSLVARPSILPTKIKQQTIEAMDVSPDGMRLVTGSGRVWVDRLKKDVQGDNCVRVWDVATGRLLAALKGHDGWLWSVCYHPDGKRVLSGGSGRAEPLDFYGHQPGADTSLRLWDVATQRELRRFDGHSAAVLEIKCSPDGRYAATGSADGTVRLWRLPD
jgi:WD40 repeat protein